MGNEHFPNPECECGERKIKPEYQWNRFDVELDEVRVNIQTRLSLPSVRPEVMPGIETGADIYQKDAGEADDICANPFHRRNPESTNEESGLANVEKYVENAYQELRNKYERGRLDQVNPPPMKIARDVTEKARQIVSDRDLNELDDDTVEEVYDRVHEGIGQRAEEMQTIRDERHKHGQQPKDKPLTGETGREIKAIITDIKEVEETLEEAVSVHRSENKSTDNDRAGIFQSDKSTNTLEETDRNVTDAEAGTGAGQTGLESEVETNEEVSQSDKSEDDIEDLREKISADQEAEEEQEQDFEPEI